MENASKALIIAGSILLSILIIALGMYIFSTSSSTSDVSVLSETEVQTFNAKFDKYKGEQLGSNVDALMKALRSNATASRKVKEKLPAIYYYNNKDKSEAGYFIYGETIDRSSPDDFNNYKTVVDNIQNEIQKSHRYNVDIRYSTSTGLVNRINIAYNTSFDLKNAK